MIARTPANEADRLVALREYHILDTEAEPAYDDIAQLAAEICGVPIALVSLVDESRQWFKARTGMEDQETSREVAFCAHAILQLEPLIVRDALKDERFVDSALVVNAPHIRFYAGYPLINPEGFALGTLCALDRKPRQLSAKQDRLMKALARQVMALLDARRISNHLAKALENIEYLHGLLPICAWCKRIRDDHGYWNKIESYIEAHSTAEFTHGICPECMDRVRTDLAQKRAEKANGRSRPTPVAKA